MLFPPPAPPLGLSDTETPLGDGAAVCCFCFLTLWCLCLFGLFSSWPTVVDVVAAVVVVVGLVRV